MASRTLTAAAVERIKPPATGQVEYFDKGFPGLALRVSYGGGKSWAFLHRLHGGKLRRLTLGTWPAMDLAQAREAWRDARKLVDKGENPARARPAQADSIEAVAAEWLKRDQAGNRSHDEVKRVMDRDVLPQWEGRTINSIGRRDAIELLDGIADRGAVTLARRTHAHLHRMFRWAVGRGVIEANPMADLPKAGAAVERDRVLSDAELKAIWLAACDTEWPFGPAIRLLILTGARRSEIGGLRWSEVHGDVIELAGERTKNSEAHRIPLAPAALAILADVPLIAGNDFVFSTTGRTPVSGWSKAKELLDKAVREKNGGEDLAPWRLHDVRRTCATGLQRLGTSLQVVEHVLGHIAGSRAGVVKIYQRHSFDAEKRTALEAWARHVEAIASGKPATVVAMRRPR